MKLSFVYIISVLLLIVHRPIGAQTFYRTGNPTDINVRPTLGILLAGGGTDNNDAMR